MCQGLPLLHTSDAYFHPGVFQSPTICVGCIENGLSAGIPSWSRRNTRTTGPSNPWLDWAPSSLLCRGSTPSLPSPDSVPSPLRPASVPSRPGSGSGVRPGTAGGFLWRRWGCEGVTWWWWGGDEGVCLGKGVPMVVMRSTSWPLLSSRGTRNICQSTRTSAQRNQ